MSSRTFLLCKSREHAEATDEIVLRSLEAKHGIRGNAWSEVYSDGTHFGILWGGHVAEALGNPRSEEYPDGNPDLKLVSDAEGAWRLAIPAANSPADI